MPTECQLDAPEHRIVSINQTPIGGIGDTMRPGSQMNGEPPETDDTDPDVIPNQYGEFYI